MIQSDSMTDYLWILNMEVTIISFIFLYFQVLPQWTSIMDIIKKVLNTACLVNKFFFFYKYLIFFF